MHYNPEARLDTIEVCVSPSEKSAAKDHCRLLGIGVSAWYRGLGKAELQRHGTRQEAVKEPRHCPGRGRSASRASGPVGVRRNL
jgi:hypothetical protein